MIPRGGLSITYKDIFAGMCFCLSCRQGTDDNNTNRLTCLSARTGFDLVLSALNLPPGSEIVVTDINIPDMFAIIAAHQLIAVPLPVNKHTLNISSQQVKNAISPVTKAILITHLFGGIMDLDEIVPIAKNNGLFVFEDCAQAFAGKLYSGHPLADIVMFSFGFIKTNTAINGAIIQVNTPALYKEVVSLNGRYPTKKNAAYLKKLGKAIFVKLLTRPLMYTTFCKLVAIWGRDLDSILSGFTKGFPGKNMLQKIRCQPCMANKKLVDRRVTNFKQSVISSRQQYANDIIKNIPSHFKIGEQNKNHSYWVLPVETDEPAKLINYLRGFGFDASQKASSLVKYRSAFSEDGSDDLLPEKLVYLPMYPDMIRESRMKLAELITGFNG